MSDVTRLLQQASNGDKAAVNELMPLIYNDLRRLAASILQYERPGLTLQPTAVVHEVYLRMFKGTALPHEDRRQFFALAARVIRQVLVDHARRKSADKRGGGLRGELPDDFALPAQQAEDLLALNEALERLSALDERQSEILEMHYFGGLAVEEIALHYSLSPRTVKRDLQSGRLFLKKQLSLCAVS
jgi:RNA polymerase sigma factor (TIGR02999 family)